ncbi:PDZ domain-containing protein [Haloferula chungangensis]|uniref:PDZ domain-containing protein n=1 Tax=Haloferula chungangensis TaxID=1048331 RepID=A0ABW2LE47_9BACT
MRPSGKYLGFVLGVATMAVATLGASGLEPPAALIKNLGADAYPERMAAERALSEWALNRGDEAKTALLELSKTSGDPEIRRRSLSALKTVVIKELTDQRPGFVGIRMGVVELSAEAAGGGVGVQVEAVTPGTPAEKAGIRVADVILKLDGKGWTRQEAQHEFAERIGGKRGGDKVKFEVLRGEERLEFELVLAHRPWSLGTYNQTLQFRGGDPFFMPNQIPPDEKSAEELAFQEWLEKQKAMTPRPRD